MAHQADSDLWYDLEGDTAAERVVDICDALGRDDGEIRRARYFAATALYEQRGISDETMRAVGWDDSCLYNVSRSAADTAQAEIAARQRPKPMYLTTGADWRTKRKAKKLDRFVEAQLHQRQGARYADAWELAEDAFLDAEKSLGGVVKVVVDVGSERIRLERVPPYEVLVDPIEAANGDPQNWFHVYDMDESRALAEFAGDSRSASAEELRAKIRDSAKTSPLAAGATVRRTSRSVKIYEAWKLPPTADEPGKHLFACERGVLWEEEWTWPWPPLAIIVWSRETFGVWGTGLIESGANQHRKISELAEKLHERIRLGGHRIVYYETGTADQAQLVKNDAITYVPVLDIGKVPRAEEVPPVTPAEVDLLEREIAKYYEFQGVSQMSAQSRKEAGVDAAIAMQTLNDIKSVRFMSKARAYELLFVRLGELIVRAARDLATEKGGDFLTKWPGKKYLQEIAWKDVDLAEEMYQVRVAPVSAMSRDPAQRLQLVEQLSNLGYLPREKYLELMQLPDLDGWLESENSANEWIERLVERYLDAEDDADLKKLGGWVEPDGYLLNPTAALATVAQHYFAALTDDVPPYNAELLRAFMQSLKEMIQPEQSSQNVAPMAPGADLAGPATMQMPPGPPAPPPGMGPPPGGSPIPMGPMGVAA